MKINKLFIIILILLSITSFYNCSKNDAEETYIPVSEIPDEPYVIDLGIFPTPDIPSDNLLTREGVKLGRMLFYEKMMSKNTTQACASCHDQKTAFSDTRKFSLGISNLPGTRHSMAIFNMAWNTNEFFWDGRAHLLRDQALLPIQDSNEMDETLVNVTSKLQTSSIYPKQFQKAFGTNIITPLLIKQLVNN